MKQDVNYITHHKAAFFMLMEDKSFHTAHLSLYNALFLLWNESGFDTSFQIIRADAMKLSRIGSANTYTDCLKDLEKKGYITYRPSVNPLICSEISLYRFDKGSDKGGDKAPDNGSVTIPIKEVIPNTVNNTNLETKKQEKPINNIEERKLKFASTLGPFIELYGQSMIDEFVGYWTEPNKSNSRFKQELEKTWDSARRLKTWSGNNFGRKTEAPIQPIATNYQTETGEQKQERYYEAKKLNPSLKWENFQ